ncbi:MAG: zinc ABC transporter substrate-binding protein [Treponema sp.]|nr:zinc ABC transporter substrate-binding protein [Treponema sp.]
MKHTVLVKAFVCAVLMSLSAGAFAAAQKSIVCVSYPEYDWVKNILGNKSAVTVTLLQNNGTDLHSYQPSVKDMAKISTCDMLVHVGGESVGWVADAVRTARNKNMVVVDMMEVLGDRVREEEIVEGMEHDDEDGEEIEYDEHIWLSLRNAVLLTQYISGKIQRLDPANAGVYRTNAESYVAQLAALDAEYVKAVAAAGRDTVLFGDRFPFRYLTDDYNLKYYAAFAGCSAESEASFETIVFLANKLDALGLNAVLTIEKSDRRLAKTVISNSRRKHLEILELDSLQSVTARELKGGRTYLSAMKGNLEVLKKALR